MPTPTGSSTLFAILISCEELFICPILLFEELGRAKTFDVSKERATIK
jgi:hypothetical protein